MTLDYIVKGVEELPEEEGEASNAIKSEQNVQATSIDNDWRNQLLLQSPFELTVHRILFLIAMLISGAVFVCAVFFSVRLIANHTSSIEGKEQGVAYVDQVYEQYTLADVQIMDENENFINKKVWLDINGVREGDYIGYYHDEGKASEAHFMYYAKSLIVPVIVVILSLIFTIICWMGFRSYGIRKNDKRKDE